MNVKIMLLFLICLIHSFVIAQNPIDKSIEKIVADPVMKHASISMTVMDVETGEIISSYQPNLSIPPASSMKVITTATALAILGKNYTFKTELQYDGSISNGVLQGNIYIKGFGDPTLGAELPKGNIQHKELMLQFVSVIKALGIQTIEGRVIGDGSYYNTESTPDSWQWNDIGNYYGAGVSGLNINANTYELSFRQNASLGKAPKVERTVPSLHNALFVNEVTSASKGSGDNCYIYGAPYQNTRFLRGTIPVGTGIFKVKGSLPDPAFTTAALLLDALEEQGVKTSKRATSQFELTQNEGKTSNSTRETIYTHRSKSLFDIAKVTNEESINLYCEAMLKAIGQKQGNKGTREKGIEALVEFWEDRGVDMDGFYMEDGCGLSTRNGITSKHFAEILRKIKIDQSFGFDFKNALAIAGKTGTFKYMFKNTSAVGKIYGKTGSMDRIRSYTGYAVSVSGKLLSFSIIINNYHCSSSVARKKLEEWMRSLLE
ncbi:MAG: D-alanyl-D-alanine carboxypeptidase/D-alanyl-D-alanine-endopeptidase (penicillin-binding protein 4) [Maribacter sp.]|jgi:D-alanyl-D-alanine carboxypeptidase/D-alanyl-D-alanine-endopeptidase (penicillin-binding protein 4)